MVTIPPAMSITFWPNPKRAFDITASKFLFHIKESCGVCGKYLKFAEQTPELMDRLRDAKLMPLQPQGL